MFRFYVTVLFLALAMALIVLSGCADMQETAVNKQWEIKQ